MSVKLPLRCGRGSVLFLFLSLCVFAQAPPPKQEQALRKQVEQFYTSMQSGKFRAAYAMVADDSQEAFMEMAKPKFSEWTIKSIDWSDEFRKAKVTLEVATEMRFSGQVVPVKRPLESLWRLEESEWVWYYSVPKEVRTPFGAVKVDPEAARKQINIKEKLDAAPKPDELAGGVQFTAPDVTFKKTEKGEAEVKIKNNLAGHVKVQLQLPKVPGLSAENPEIGVGPNQEGTLKLRWDPEGVEPPEKNFRAAVVANPIGGSRVFAITWTD